MMGVLRVYIDESGSHNTRGQGEPLIVTGCVSTPLDWERLDRQWHALLRKYHLSYMNFDDLCNLRQDDFKGRSATEQQEIFKDFGTAAHVHTWFGFNTILYDKDFKRFKGPTKGVGSDLSKLLDSDYGVSIRVIYAFLHTWVPKIPGINDPLLFVIAESGHRNEGAVCSLFEEYKRTFPETEQIIKGARLVDKRSQYGVQGADFHGGCIQMAESKNKATYKEVSGPAAEAIGEYVVHTPTRVRWFRLPINEGVLTHLKNSVILSKPKFIALYGEQLTPPLSDFSKESV